MLGGGGTILLLRLLKKRHCGAEPYFLMGTREQRPSRLGNPPKPPLSSLVDDSSEGRESMTSCTRELADANPILRPAVSEAHGESEVENPRL